MSRVFINGLGAVSPAGWGVPALRASLAAGVPLPETLMERPLWPRPVPCRTVPAPVPRPAFLQHPRFRRTSPISQYAVAAACEALGPDIALAADRARIGIIFCVMVGCVNYSLRFYAEALADPGTASPLVFPETVFNAPSSHIAALLGLTGVNYTLVGDQGTYLQGLASAAEWLADGRVDACLVLAAEEVDWVVVDAFRMFHRETIVSAGAGAVLLSSQPPVGAGVELAAITSAQGYSPAQSRLAAMHSMRAELPSAAPGELLCDSRPDLITARDPETISWRDWSAARLSPKSILGEALSAATAWQCVAAADALQLGQHPAATLSVCGSNQQAIGARLVRWE